MDGTDTREHWDQIFASRGEHERSWTQDEPSVSMERIAACTTDLDAPIIDVGGGASRLVDGLLQRGCTDVTVLDISATALKEAAARVGDAARVEWVATDVLAWRPTRRYAVWHDRAVFHFLDHPDDQQRYVTLATAAVMPGGHLVMATFAPDGPATCSGLPVQRWSASELAERFDADFELVDHEVLVHRTPSGGRQPFTWVTLRRSPARP